MDYFNFDLKIRKKSEDHYPVEVETEEGMGDAEGALKLDPQSLADDREKLDQDEVDDDFLKNFGRALYNHLFDGEVQNKYKQCVGRYSKDAKKGVRLLLSIQPSELSAIPWELLYDKSNDCFLATSIKTPLTRCVHASPTALDLKTKPPIRVLVVIPSASTPDTKKEKGIIEKALGRLGKHVRCRILEGEATRRKISDELDQYKPHIFHFIGHGGFKADSGYLRFDSEFDPQGFDDISGEDLKDLFRNCLELKLVILNSCSGAKVSANRAMSGIAPQLVSVGIPAVIAMQYPIQDRAATEFTRVFYRKLCSGLEAGEIDTAITHARNAIRFSFKRTMARAFVTPVLFMRSRTGTLFTLRRPFWELFPFRYLYPLVASVQELSLVRKLFKAHQSNIEALIEHNEEPGVDKAQDILKERLALDEFKAQVREWRASIWVALAITVMTTLFMAFAAWVNLFDAPFALDARTEYFIITYMDSYVGRPDKLDGRVAMILAEENNNGALGSPLVKESDSAEVKESRLIWRQYHAKLIDALRTAGAKVIVLDFRFDSSGQSTRAAEYDKALAAAIAADNRTVAGGLEIPPQGLPSALKEALKDRRGFTEEIATLFYGTNIARGAKLGKLIEGDEGNGVELPIDPSLILKAVMQFYYPDQSVKPFYNALTNEVVLRSGGAEGEILKTFPVDDQIAITVNLAAPQVFDNPATRFRYAEVLEKASSGKKEDQDRLKDLFENKLVVIGYKNRGDADNRGDIWQVTKEGEMRFGAELLTNAISNVLQDSYIRQLSPLYFMLLLLSMSVIGVLIQVWLGYRMHVGIPLQLLILTLAAPVYLLVAFVVYKQFHIWFNIIYPFVTLMIAYWITGLLQKSRSLKRVLEHATPAAQS